ncbi:MAG: S8 family serine peptidase [bacterium]|nr:S8 family serine peptidase [bacterium]
MRKLALMLLILSLAGSAWATTFTPELVTKLNTSSDNELIRVLITMDQQADFNWMVATTAQMSKMERRQFVVNHLNQLAEISQIDVMAYLKNYEASGKVEHMLSVSLVNIIQGLATPEVIRGLMNFPEVAEVAYDPERYMLDDVPKEAEPIQSEQPKVDNTDEIAWGVADVHAPEVWAQGYEGDGIIVGMLDTGVNYNHLDLTTHMWNGGPSYPNHGWDFYNNDNDPTDGHGHGTHTAGTVASDGTAGTQAGVAPHAIIMALKVWSDGGSGSTGQMISGSDFAVQHGADLFSMSGGIGGGGTTTDKNLFRTAYNNALAAGVIGTIAAGNEAGTSPPNSVRTPGNVPPPWLHPDQTLIGGLSCVITCGATNPDHTIASFSSKGPVNWSNVSPWNDYAYPSGMGLIEPDISAPGVNVKSCLNTNNTGYQLMSGTSMATPHVAGVVALLLSKDPSLTPDLIDMYLENTALELGTPGKDNTFGSGLMNALDAINAFQVGPGPALIVSGKVIDDIGGNNNNAPDPGETCSMVVTLKNVAQDPGTNIHATLSTTDPYLTITQNSSTYPNLAHLEEGQGSPAYMFNVSSTCPQGQNVTCLLHITADSAYTNEANITFVVGDPLNSPSGPDAYGYRAYDPYDTPELPVYSWAEISADSSGPGTMIAFTSDDQVFSYDLPFSFVYYGQTFSRYTVGANGWVAMGDVLADDYSNSGIPNTDGPEAMIAAYWEDLSPQRTNSGKVWSWFDATNHRLIVEYNHIEQFAPVGAFETFQIILLDPAYYQTISGDGRIKVQYKDMSASAQTEGTIGIENPAETVGIQYFFDGTRDQNAHAITNRFSILYTTATGVPPVVWDITTSAVSPPVVIPANGGSFPYNINVHNLTTTPQTGSVWNKVRNASNVYTQVFGPVTRTLPGGANPSRVMTQTIAGSISSGTLYFISYMGTYPNTISDSSFFTITKSTVSDGGSWIGESYVTGDFFDEFAVTNNAVPTEYSLGQNYPNPFNPLTSISFNLPQAGLVKLTVFDVMGREVAQLVNGVREAGTHSVTFDATHLASGIYLYKLEAGEYSATNKMVLMK